MKNKSAAYNQKKYAQKKHVQKRYVQKIHVQKIHIQKIYVQKIYIQDVLKGMGMAVFLGFLFYSNVIGIMILLPFSLVYANKKKKGMEKEKKWQLNLEFLDGLHSLSTALSAGYAVENAWMEALKDLKTMYEKDAVIIQEFEYMAAGLQNNITIEEVLKEFALRTKIEDIHDFCQVFITAKNTGGDLVKIIGNTCKIIGDKVEVKREIATMIAAKKLEGRIMNVIPIIIIIYLRIGSPDFLKPLYHNVFGFFFMSGVLILYYIAFMLSERIMSIEV